MPEETPNTGGTPNPGEQNSQREDQSTLPEWARNAISRGNNESAEWRVKFRNKEAEHTATLTELATLKETVATSQESATKATTELLKLSVALAAGIPGEKAAAFAARLQGTTEDELKADAESLKGVFPTDSVSDATDPSQGRGASTPLSPEAAFAAMLKGQLDPLLNK